MGTITRLRRRLQWHWLPADEFWFLDGGLKAVGHLYDYIIESNDGKFTSRGGRWRLSAWHNRPEDDDHVCPICEGFDYPRCWLMPSDSIEEMQIEAQDFENDPEAQAEQI
jgi:hypothetical protein